MKIYQTDISLLRLLLLAASVITGGWLAKNGPELFPWMSHFAHVPGLVIGVALIYQLTPAADTTKACEEKPRNEQ